MSLGVTADQKTVVLREGKDAAFVRARRDFEIDLHLRATD
jgi:hypothetical protein